MKKIILATLISCAMSASAFAGDEGKGTVTFTGSIISAPCSIAPGEENQEVPLGQVSDMALKDGGESEARHFSIKLEGCKLNKNNEVSITFNGTKAGETDLLQITGDAKGAAVKLMNTSGTQIKVNEAYKQSYVAGNNELKFAAALKGLNDVDVSPGNFSAVTRFTLAYQ